MTGLPNLRPKCAQEKSTRTNPTCARRNIRQSTRVAISIKSFEPWRTMSRFQQCQIRARLPRPRMTSTIMKLVPVLRAVARSVHDFLRAYTPAHTVVMISRIGFLHAQVLEKAFAAGMAAGSMLISKVLNLAAPLASHMRTCNIRFPIPRPIRDCARVSVHLDAHFQSPQENSDEPRATLLHTNRYYLPPKSHKPISQGRTLQKHYSRSCTGK